MSLLHSFYCWGHVGVVLISTIFFSTFGIANWKILARIWAVIPVLNGIIFLTSPIYSLHEEGEKGLSIRELCSMKIFWVVMLMMTCAVLWIFCWNYFTAGLEKSGQYQYPG